jgi:tight adherence protein C
VSKLQFVYLILGSILAILFTVKSISGQKYNNLVENLDSEEYPLKSIYCVGFSWSSLPALKLKGKMQETLVGQAKLLHDSKYAEYYANVAWAQFLSFTHLSLTLGFLLAGIMNSGLMLLIGVAVAIVFGYYFLNRMNSLLKDRATECTSELPEIVSTMALLINAGMMVRNAWRTIADSKEGTVYDLMKQSCSDMSNGMSEVDAIHRFGRLSNSAEVRKFTSALTQSIECGGAELNNFLARQSVEIWTLKKQMMLQKGEAASSELLAPTAMLFIGIIIAVITGALGMLI